MYAKLMKSGTIVSAAMALCGGAGLLAYYATGTHDVPSAKHATAMFSAPPSKFADPGVLAGKWRVIGKSGADLEFSAGSTVEGGRAANTRFKTSGTKVVVERDGMPPMTLDTSTPNVASGEGMYLLKVVAAPKSRTDETTKPAPNDNPSWAGKLR